MRKGIVFLVLCWCVSLDAAGQYSLGQSASSRLFASGNDLLDHQEYASALDQFKQFLDIAPEGDPRRAEASYRVAFCALQLYHPLAEKQIRSFTEVYPQHPLAAQAYFDLANFFYQSKEYRKSAEAFGKVSFADLSAAQQSTGHFRWGYSLFSQKNLVDALDQFNAVKALGGAYGPAASYYAGYIELSEGDFDNALLDLKRAEGNEAYQSVVPVLLATTYYRLGRDEELLRYAKEVKDREGLMGASEIGLLQAEVLWKKGKFAEAFPFYSAYLDKSGTTDRQVWLRAGYAGYITGRNDVSLQYLGQATDQEDSVGAMASYYIGLVHLRKKEKQMALTSFEFTNRVSKNPSIREESQFLGAKINYELGQSDAAILSFEKILTDYPATTHGQEIRELLSQAYVNANNYNKAIAYIESISRRTPAVDRAYQKASMLKGEELFNREEYGAAVEMFEKSLQYPLDPRWSSEAAFWSAEAYSIGRRYDQAVPQYEKALSLAPADSRLIKDMRYGLGYAFYNQQEYEKALTQFKAFSALATPADPNHADGMLRYADCLYTQKSFSEALQLYRKVIQVRGPDTDYAQLQAGLILSVQRDYAGAAHQFEDVYANKESRYAEDALFQHGQIEFEQSHYAAAVTFYSRLIDQSRSNRLLPYAYTRRAAAYYNLKNYAQTADDYIKVVKEFPSHPAARDLLLPLQEALQLAGRTDEFDQYLAAFKQANPDAKGIESVEFESAKNLYFNQQYAKAVDYLGRFVNGYPDSPMKMDALYYQAESYYRLKDYQKAEPVYTQLSSEKTFSSYSKVVGRLAELQARKGDYANAVRSFQKLAVVAGNKKDLQTAYNGLMEGYFLLAQHDSSDMFAVRILELGNVQASAQNKAMLYQGKNAMARGDNESAKDFFLATLNTARDEYGAEAKYRLGEIFFLSKDHKQCYETLLALNAEFEAYPEWVGKSFLLLADNFAATGDYFQARATLQSLVDKFPQESIKTAAREKLLAVEQEELKKKQLNKPDTTGNDR